MSFRAIPGLLTFLVWQAFASSSFSADYYVSPQGDNRAEGSRDSPFRNIQRALQVATQPGDSVIVREGTYTPSLSVNLGNSGKKDAFITLRAEKDESVIIDGSLMAGDSNVIAVLGAYIRVEGLTVRNAKSTGLVVWGPGARTHHVEFINNTVEDSQKGGIYAGTPNRDDPVRDILMEGNTITRTSLVNETRAQGVTWAFGVGGGMTKNLTIRDNTVFENHGEGIGLYLSDGGLVEGNRAFDNFAVNLYLDNTTNTRVRRNLCYSTGKAAFFRFGKPTNGIQIANETYRLKQNPSFGNVITDNLLLFNGSAFYVGAYQLGGGFRDSVFSNNTCYGSARDLLMIDPDPGHRNSRVEKNVFVQIGDLPMTYVEKARPGVTFANNLWFGRFPPRPDARSETDLSVDPGFANPGGFKWDDYQLNDESPAKGLGVRFDLVPPGAAP